MGYYTSFSLTVEGGDPEVIIPQLRDENDHASCALEDDGSTRDSVKWYDYTEQLQEFSKKYPEVLFILEGQGEESGDIWKCYFKNGKYQMAQAVITFEEYDESKLRD